MDAATSAGLLQDGHRVVLTSRLPPRFEAMLADANLMRSAIRLARRAFGETSPNPLVGALLVKGGRIIGRGWHRRAGEAHAEIEAIRNATQRGHSPRGATLVVTLEPCSTQGRTPPCTSAIKAAGIIRVVAGPTDPNPRHAGRGFALLKRSGIEVAHGVLAGQCAEMNEAFNHWIVHRTPFVTVKAAMTLDGKIATSTGESKWITGEQARRYAMKLRRGSDAILVGINTILADDPSLTVRPSGPGSVNKPGHPRVRRIILDSLARTPLEAKVVRDGCSAMTTIVVGTLAPKRRIVALAKHVNVLVAPIVRGDRPGGAPGIDLRWLLNRLGSEEVTSLLVEGGGEVNASFLLGGHAQRVAFFYAPKILGGSASRPGVAGKGIARLDDLLELRSVKWRRLGLDVLLSARVASGG